MSSFLAKSAREEPSAVGLPRLLRLLRLLRVLRLLRILRFASKSALWILWSKGLLRWKCLTPESLGCFVRAFDSGVCAGPTLQKGIGDNACIERHYDIRKISKTRRTVCRCRTDEELIPVMLGRLLSQSWSPRKALWKSSRSRCCPAQRSCCFCKSQERCDFGFAARPCLGHIQETSSSRQAESLALRPQISCSLSCGRVPPSSMIWHPAQIDRKSVV